MLRTFDPRANKCIQEVSDHQGTKGGRVVYLKKKNLIFTCGFSKGSERQLALYDPRKMDQRLTLQVIDSSSSALMPFYDEDNSILFLAGKGDGNIRSYEISAEEDPFVFFLNEFKSKDPQSGMTMLPKWSCNVANCEIDRLVKITPQGMVVNLKFEVPRKDQFFQDDLFPDTLDTTTPCCEASDWFNGANPSRHTRSLKDIFDKK